MNPLYSADELSRELTGEVLYELYVDGGVCTSFTYQWDRLSPEMRRRWDLLAFNVRVQVLGSKS